MKTHRHGSAAPKYNTLIWLLPLCIALFGAFLAAPSARERKIQQEIAAEILRFHILANSDSPEDQQEKLRVRDAVIRELQPVLAVSSSKKETKQLVKSQMKQIEETASRIVSPRKVKVSLNTDWFPEKTYGDCTFPEGEYEALRIEIGEAKGHNWWCVLYPGLCFTEAVQPVVTEEGKEKLEGVLEEEAFEFVLHPVKIRWRWMRTRTQRD